MFISPETSPLRIPVRNSRLRATWKQLSLLKVAFKPSLLFVPGFPEWWASAGLTISALTQLQGNTGFHTMPSRVLITSELWNQRRKPGRTHTKTLRQQVPKTPPQSLKGRTRPQQRVHLNKKTTTQKLMKKQPKILQRVAMTCKPKAKIRPTLVQNATMIKRYDVLLTPFLAWFLTFFLYKSMPIVHFGFVKDGTKKLQSCLCD